MGWRRMRLWVGWRKIAANAGGEPPRHGRTAAWVKATIGAVGSSALLGFDAANILCLLAFLRQLFPRLLPGTLCAARCLRFALARRCFFSAFNRSYSWTSLTAVLTFASAAARRRCS